MAASLTPEDRQELIERYACGPQRLRQALAGAPEEMRKWRPAPGAFSVHEIVCHCADSETNDHGRIRYLVAEKEPVILAYDQDNWAASLEYHAHPLDAALATIDAVRANTVPLLQRLSEKAWASEGTHTESGPFSAADWLRTCAVHLDEHADQLQAVVAAWHAAGAS